MRWPRRLRVRVSYFNLHLLYFLSLGVLGGTAAFVIEGGETGYLDCLFMAYSACTLTGLSSIDIHSWKPGSMVILLIMMTLGNQVLMSTVPILIRESYFRRAFSKADIVNQDVLKENTEFRALHSLRRITLSFYLAVITLFFTALGPYVTYVWGDVFRRNGNNPTWFAFVTTLSAWSNCGITTLSDNLTIFQTDYMVLLSVALLVSLGNVMYPIALRFTIYVLHFMYPKYKPYKFLLRYPRRCSTHLFPGTHTKILFLCVMGMTILQYVMFMIFEFNGSMADLPGDDRSLCCWFQAVSTRTGGFNAVDLSLFAPCNQFLLAVMMYVSSYPIISGLRSMTEESQQYVVLEDGEEARETLAEATIDVQTKSKTFAAEVRDRCMADLWLLGISLFIMAAFEGDHIREGRFTIFSLIFEVCSSYGTVGLSLGFPGKQTSLSGGFRPVSKVAIIVVMLAGRHRGLPRSIDRAVNLRAMSGDADIAADPQLAAYLEAVTLAVAELEKTKATAKAARQAGREQAKQETVKNIEINMSMSDEPAASGNLPYGLKDAATIAATLITAEEARLKHRGPIIPGLRRNSW